MANNMALNALQHRDVEHRYRAAQSLIDNVDVQAVEQEVIEKNNCIRTNLLTSNQRKKVNPHGFDYRIGVGPQPEAEYDDHGDEDPSTGTYITVFGPGRRAHWQQFAVARLANPRERPPHHLRSYDGRRYGASPAAGILGQTRCAQSPTLVPGMSNRLVWSAIGAFIAVLVVAVAVLYRDGNDHSTTAGQPASPSRFEAADAAAPAIDPQISEPASPSPADLVEAVPSLDELARLCVDPWSGSGSGCAKALDRRYLREPVGLAGLHNGPSEWNRSAASPAFEGIAWKEVFEDPLGTRAAAQEALSRPECRVSPLETRPDLGAVCAVDEIAKLAMLQAGCVMELVYYKPGFNPWGSPDDLPGWEKRAPDMDAKWWQYEALDEETSMSMEEYYRRRAEIDDARFRFAWRLMRCKAVTDDALAWLDELPTPAAGGHQGRDLTEMAARLGSEWAMRELEQSKQLLDAERRERFERWKQRQQRSQGSESGQAP